ncbi:siderophore-interacting protein [Mycobacterium sp. AZCC_0083]|uniref:siderophore-interacting protein n=1 Tax=Mycobacterium sp. AZCC_0083 TaxID=2735882 RepID=UPI00160CEE62|nr:siderophore-interacting protein [Mycobacterium sp. AZCC_0083]MBB5160698.1 NADPH-dependent ferric siderophore reductase [Mycobacterium sp. AZCC_0083]
MSFSYATVIETIQLTPRLRRITLKVDDPELLEVKPGGDSAVGVYFPIVGPDGERTGPPTVTGADGGRYVDPESGSEGRNYTVRTHDGDRIDLDVILHARGPGTAWASSTGPGDRVGLDHARSWYRPEPASDWQLLVTDLSGLPAAARIISELPGGVPVTVVVEAADPEDLEYLPTHPDVTVVSSVGTGNGHAPSRLARLVRELTLPEGRGYCWFAAEAAESRAVRKYFRGNGWTVEQLDVTGYWRFDSETWDAKFALVQDDVVAVWERALADGKGERVADEEFDEALERAGL